MIVISLKEEFYAKADALIGIYPEVTPPSSLLGRAAAGVLQGGLRLTLFKEIRLKSNHSGFSATVQRDVRSEKASGKLQNFLYKIVHIYT